MSHKSLWYWKQNGKVTGPFAEGLIQKYIILRRVHPNDELSQDRKFWKKASTIYELVPDVIRNKNDENYDERLKAAKRWADDRGDSRENLVDDSFKQRKKMTHLEINTLGWKTFIIAIFVLCGFLFAFFYFTPEKKVIVADCSVTPIARVDLQGCDLSRKNLSKQDLQYANFNNTQFQNSNLSKANLAYSQFQYSQLSYSNLSYTKFGYADLTAAMLDNTNLSGADFSHANLSYANLQGAKAKNIILKGANLSKTIWFNGQICASGSIGRCLISKSGEK